MIGKISKVEISLITTMQITIVIFGIVGSSMFNPAIAQTYVKEGKLYVHTNSKINISGDVLNQGVITNQGTISVSGHWNNVASYVSSGGTIALTGSETQVFFHNDQTTDNLIITNSTGVSLASDVTIQNELILQEGIVILKAGKKLVLKENAFVQGGGPNAYVSGKVYHTGIGNKFYPVGKNGQYAPVNLTNIQGENPVVGVEFYEKGLHNHEESSLWLHAFYWNLSTLSGKFNGSPVSLDALIPNPLWQEEDDLIIAGSDNIKENFKSLDQAKVQFEGNWYTFSGSLPIRSQYITLGIQEREKELVYVPNVFSPFAPHADDRTIKVYSKNIDSKGFQWTIWDCWGHMVYATNSYDQAANTGWQGTHKEKGEALPGIYKYFLQGTFTSGQTFSKTGNIILHK